jgi:hypothetical protein
MLVLLKEMMYEFHRLNGLRRQEIRNKFHDDRLRHLKKVTLRLFRKTIEML